MGGRQICDGGVSDGIVCIAPELASDVDVRVMRWPRQHQHQSNLEILQGQARLGLGLGAESQQVPVLHTRNTVRPRSMVEQQRTCLSNQKCLHQRASARISFIFPFQQQQQQHRREEREEREKRERNADSRRYSTVPADYDQQ